MCPSDGFPMGWSNDSNSCCCIKLSWVENPRDRSFAWNMILFSSSYMHTYNFILLYVVNYTPQYCLNSFDLKLIAALFLCLQNNYKNWELRIQFKRRKIT